MHTRTKIFNEMTLGQRMLHKRFLGKIPALPLAVLLVIASVVAAAFFALGPTTTSPVVLGKMVTQGLPTSDILYGQVGGPAIWFNITVATNSYTQAHSAYTVLAVSTSGTTFPNVGACNAELLVEQSDNATTPTWTTISATYAGGTCTYTGTLTQNVNASMIGANAPTWPFRIQYLSSPVGRGPTYTWTSQFWGI